MATLTRRSLLHNSVGLAAAGALARPYTANAAATTVETWWNQGFIPEEDAAFRAMVADYEKASGDKIDYSLIPNAPLRQKEISAIQSGVVPDLMEVADPRFTPLNAWSDNLLDLGDLVEPEKSHYSPTALSCCHHYNSMTKQRGYYMVPMKLGTWPFHIWKSLVEKGGAKISDLPNTWDAFLDFFKPVQVKLRAQGMRNVYAYGYQLTGNGYDPVMTYNHFMIAYGGKGFITPDGKLHTDDPKVREAAVKALVTLTTPYKEGYVPPGVVSWNDADDNNAFHSKLMVVDFDGSISTELALYSNKEEYNDILTHELPLGNDGEKLPAQVVGFGPVIPKGAKKSRGGQRVYQLHARAQGIERISEGQPWPVCYPDARDCQERSVLAQRRPAPHRAHSAGADRSDVADLRGLQPGDRGGQRRARLQHRRV